MADWQQRVGVKLRRIIGRESVVELSVSAKLHHGYNNGEFFFNSALFFFAAFTELGFF
jgi:hypothetical protein